MEGKYFDLIKNLTDKIKINLIRNPSEIWNISHEITENIGGVQLSDFWKVQILSDYGGIHLDWDYITLSSFNHYLDYDFSGYFKN